MRQFLLKGKHYYLIPAYDFLGTSYATRELYPWTKIEIKVGSHRPRFHGIRTFWLFLMHFRKQNVGTFFAHSHLFLLIIKLSVTVLTAACRNPRVFILFHRRSTLWKVLVILLMLSM